MKIFTKQNVGLRAKLELKNMIDLYLITKSRTTNINLDLNLVRQMSIRDL